jgi:hypothetical protein
MLYPSNLKTISLATSPLYFYPQIFLNSRTNYLYNLGWVDEPTHLLSKFNIMLEFPRVEGFPEWLMVSLEYNPTEKVLRLLTAC